MRTKFVLLVLAVGLPSSFALDTNAVLAAWLGSQTNLQTWSADFIQTRSLKSLTHPLTATGHVWFAAPNQFRWELGKPAQTIALRKKENLELIYPRLKRVERFPLTGNKLGQWRDALALLEAGFPRSRSELDAQFNIVSIQETNQIVEVNLAPRSSGAKRFMPKISLTFDPRDQTLKATELNFSDGSKMRNDFSNLEPNPKLPDKIFDPPIDPSFQVVEPVQ